MSATKTPATISRERSNSHRKSGEQKITINGHDYTVSVTDWVEYFSKPFYRYWTGLVKAVSVKFTNVGIKQAIFER